MPRSPRKVPKLLVLTTLMEIIEKMRVRVKRDGLARRAAGVGNERWVWRGSGRKASSHHWGDAVHRLLRCFLLPPILPFSPRFGKSVTGRTERVREPGGTHLGQQSARRWPRVARVTQAPHLNPQQEPNLKSNHLVLLMECLRPEVV